MSELIRLEQRRNEKYKTTYLEVVENPDLSWKAKGLHLYLMSRPPNWQIRYNDLLRRAKDSKTSLSSAIKELKAAGYLATEPVQADGSGLFVGSKWTVTESKGTSKQEDEPYPGNPEHGESNTWETGVHSSKQVVEEVNKDLSKYQTTSSDKPRTRMPNEELTRLTEHFAETRGVRPKGKAWLPIQQGMKAMVIEEGYTVNEVIGCMDRLSLLGWTWTINTVRKWIADFAAGKMPDSNSAIGNGSLRRVVTRPGEYADAFETCKGTE